MLDFGTGTGVWAIDFAEEFPDSQVLGTDLSPIQPTWFPLNCRFEVDDVESEWLDSYGPFDFIHGRGMTGAIGDWPKLFRQAYDNLRPGGWLELQDHETVFTSDDGTHLQAVNFKLWQDKLNEASQLFGKSFKDYEFHKERMEEAGFVDVVDDAYRVCVLSLSHLTDIGDGTITDFFAQVPMGTWPKDKRMKEIGRFQLFHALEALESYSLAIFTRVLKWTPEETRDLIAKVKAEGTNPHLHLYSSFRFVYGRKGES